MRKVDPNKIRLAFCSQADDLRDTFDRLSDAIISSPHAKKDQSQLASATFLSLFVSFENFLSDLFLAYLNNDFSKYQASLANSINQSLTDRYGSWPASRTSFSEEKHLPLDQLQRIVDPTGWNLTFKDANDIIVKANKWLSSPHRSRVQSITASHIDLIDTARSIRDYIAHRSSGSKSRMNQQLQIVANSGSNVGLETGCNVVHNEGAYLKTVMSSGERRVVRYANELKVIATMM